MSDDTITIEVDGEPVEARKGQMVIEVTDAVGTYIPRFCYHEKLSIAANCRMCLVEAEMGGRPAPKPLPACATPVADGMKIFTKSPKAIAAQRATMEFLLINHPLDCPICDQGGECELQDLAVGYGRNISRYNDGKRVVKDKDIGPLVSTDMTRCIHCTRCVRFGEEVSGIPQLGTTERGENMKIGTYIESAVDHELSANIIDLCPVGALNNKPYRYSARAWEMIQNDAVAPHDCVGTNLYAHTLRGRVKRIVPRQNDAINETWISDRDRFSYEAIYSDERLSAPRIKEGGQWRDASWDEALESLAEAMKAAGENTGILVSPSTTLEEGHLLSKLADALETSHLDYRLRRRDFSDQTLDPAYPSLGVSIAELESRDALLVVGSNIRSEAPILAHRVRKAALNGAQVSFVNSQTYPMTFDSANDLHGKGLVDLLSGIAVAACGKKLPASIKTLCANVTATEQQIAIAKTLKDGVHPHILLGVIARNHGAYSAIRALALAIAQSTGASIGEVSEGANSAGLSQVGVLPHRRAGAQVRESFGLDAQAIASASLETLLLVNVEPDADLPHVQLGEHKFVAALTAFRSDALDAAADLMLPAGTWAESAGTFVNIEGLQQSYAGFASPVGDARPLWKILRVLGNLIGAEGFDYVSAEDVLEDIEHASLQPGAMQQPDKALLKPNGADDPAAVLDLPIYSVDSLVRRAHALQLTDAAHRARDEEAGS